MTNAKHRTLLWTLSVMLALATGAALSETVQLATTPIAVVDHSTATAEAVRAFYDEINGVLRSGDPSALDRVVAPAFTNHAEPMVLSPDRSGLERYLATLRATTPDARFSLDDLVVVGDLAMARVTLRDAGQREFLGAAVPDAQPVWGTTDVLRVADGRVVERWGDAGESALLEPLGELDLGMRFPVTMGMALERLILGPDDLLTAQLAESRLLMIEDGSLTLTVEAVSGRSTPLVRTGASAGAGTSAVVGRTVATLVAGDLVALPSSAAYELRNDGPRTATMLVVAIYVPDAPQRATYRADPAYQNPGTPSPGANAVQTLAGGFTVGMPQEAVSGSIGRVTLAPGGELSGFTAPGPLLLTVESGAVEIDVPGSTAWMRDAAIGTTRIAASGSLNDGDGAIVPAGRTISFSNPHGTPAVVLLVTIGPHG